MSVKNFQKELAAFRDRWPDYLITFRDRATYNRTMLKVNERARLKKKKQKRKKAVAT